MVREPDPHITKAGQYLLWVIGGVIVVLMCGMLISACMRRPVRQQAERPYSQGYETPQGYMQPDHSALYYWMMYSLLRQDVTPTYTIYVPPPGYAPTYRPWHPDPIRTAPTTTMPAPTRTSGGFSSTPAKPATPTASPANPPTRTSGGFSSTPAKPSPPPSRTSGGFSSSSSPSKPAASSPSRSSGGFGGKK